MVIEIKTVVAGRGRGLSENEHKGNIRVIEMFYVLMEVVASWVNIPVEIHRTAYLRMSFLLYENYTSIFKIEREKIQNKITKLQ